MTNGTTRVSAPPILFTLHVVVQHDTSLENCLSYIMTCFTFGDFNVHFDKCTHVSIAFDDTCISLDLKQHVNISTNIHNP